MENQVKNLRNYFTIVMILGYIGSCARSHAAEEPRPISKQKLEVELTRVYSKLDSLERSLYSISKQLEYTSSVSNIQLKDRRQAVVLEKCFDHCSKQWEYIYHKDRDLTQAEEANNIQRDQCYRSCNELPKPPGFGGGC